MTNNSKEFIDVDDFKEYIDNALEIFADYPQGNEWADYGFTTYDKLYTDDIFYVVQDGNKKHFFKVFAYDTDNNGEPFNVSFSKVPHEEMIHEEEFLEFGL